MLSVDRGIRCHPLTPDRPTVRIARMATRAHCWSWQVRPMPSARARLARSHPHLPTPRTRAHPVVRYSRGGADAVELQIRPDRSTSMRSRRSGPSCRSGRSCWPTSRRRSACSRRSPVRARAPAGIGGTIGTVGPILVRGGRTGGRGRRRPRGGAGHRGRAGAAPRPGTGRPARPWSRSRGRCARLACPICPPRRRADGLRRVRGGRAARRPPGPRPPRRRSLRSDCSSSTAPWSSITGISACSWSPTCRPDGSTRGSPPSRRWPTASTWPPRPSCPGSGRYGRDRGRAEHARRALPRDRGVVQGAHPRRRHLPGRAVETGHVPRARRRVRDLPAAAGREPRALHVLRADVGHRVGRLSPEPLVRVEEGRVSTRPIAGTGHEARPRCAIACSSTSCSPILKEQAEHAMLVDLARNDLGRVCIAGSVEPTWLMEVERLTR